MKTLQQLISEQIDSEVNTEFKSIISEIVQRANSKDKNLSNKIPKSFEIVSDANNYKLVAFRWVVQAWETGRGKRKSTVKTDFEQKLERWVIKRGLAPQGKESQRLAKTLRFLINKRGTKNFPTRTGILSDVITDKRLQMLASRVGAVTFETVSKEIDRIIGDNSR